jgi:gamma-glutamyltranspeptidase / glutathione hydrolase
MVGTRPEVRGSRGVVSAGHELAVDAALGALARGGTAIDAVVAGAFTAFVAEPNNAGVGGYGHLSAFLAGGGRFVSVDHSPRAPSRASASMFDCVEPASGHEWPSVVGDRNSAGALAAAVPGAVVGLWDAHRLGGRLPWSDLLRPAIELAERGLEVTWVLQIEIANHYDEIAARPALAAMLLPRGRIPRSRSAEEPGERLWQADLARTLEAIAVEGPAGLYVGDRARRIADTVAAGGGILGEDDLASYRTRVVDEEPATYRDLRYITCVDTVGYETLGILDHFDLAAAGPTSATGLHLMAEAMGHAFADGASYGGDPEFDAEPVAELGGRAFAATRASTIAEDRAAPRPIRASAPWLAAGQPPRPSSAGGVHGTTQVVAADAEGNVAALITTIGADFGSLVAVPDTGVILNNGMVNYDPRPDRSNSIAPGKMPFFAVPAIVAARGGRAVFAAAGSGGYPILGGVITTTVGVVDHRLGVQAAVDLPRVHSQGEQTFVDSRVPEAVRERLVAMGHELAVQSVAPGELAFSRVSAVTIDPDGALTAGAGPSWNTATGAL